MRKLYALLLSALVFTSFASCGKNEGTVKTAKEDIPVSDSGVSEVITPDEDSKEYELGDYRVTSKGTKLYYDENIDTEIMLALEKYFISFADGDFEAYKSCLYPSYITEYESFLQKEYEYGLDTSFQTQCDNLNEKMGGQFKVTRVKAEKDPEMTDEQKDEKLSEFFSSLNEFFGKDYYEELKGETDGFEYLTFFIMGEDSNGEETMIVSEFNIVFAQKDGNYYLFG